MNPFLIIEKYYSTNPPLKKILLRHSEQVKDKALRISKQHPELNLNNEFIYEASLLHDIGIYLCKAPEIYCFGDHAYIEHAYLGAEILRKEGFPLHALVCERHTGAGISLKNILHQNLPLPHKDMQPQSLEEKLICYADKFFSKSKLDEEITIEKIKKQLLKYGEEEFEKFERLHQLFQ